MDYSVIKPASIRPLVAAGGGQAFQQQAGERRRRASSLQLASPPVATRNGLASLLLESAIMTRKFCYRAEIPWLPSLASVKNRFFYCREGKAFLLQKVTK